METPLPYPCSHRSSLRNLLKYRSKRGFALIATISIMGLLIMVALGMLSLSTVELRSSQNERAMAEAQANARMALIIAIGELQRQMGADQRISMTADQRMPDGGDGSTSSAANGNRHWTGVYDSWPSTEEDRPATSSAFRSWLVSGASNLRSQEATPDATLAIDESIELVGAGTMGPSDPSQWVRVPAVDVQAGTNREGRLAWWVGDQGVKAAMSTPPPASNASLAYVRNNLSSAPRNAHELVTLADGTTKPFENIAPSDDRLRKLLSWQQAALLSSSPDAPCSLFHDIAAHSSGLLTNVRKGGFRKDLSMKMEYHTEAPDLTDPSNVLYRVRSNATGNDEVGINFMELWAYYHLYKQLKYDGGLTYTTGGGIPISAPYLETKSSIEGPDGIVEDNWDMFKHPLVINYEMLLSMEIQPHDILADSTGAIDRTINGLFINHDAIITLWNPHDVAIHIKSFRPSQSFGTHPRKNCYLFFYPDFPYDLNLTINGSSQVHCPLNRVTQSSIAMDVGRVEDPTKDDPIILKPGEVVMFSQVGSNNHSQSGRIEVPYWGSGFSSLRLFGGKGFNFGGGMAAIARDDTNSTSVYQQRNNPAPRASNVGAEIGLNLGDILSYSLSPRSDRDGDSLLNWRYMIGNPWGRHMRGLSIYGSGSLDGDRFHTRAQEGDTVNDRMSIPNPFNYVPTDAAVSDLFPTLEGGADTQELTYARLVDGKVPFASISLRAKTEVDGLRGTKTLARLNPKAHFINFWDLAGEERDMLPFEMRIRPVTSFLDSGLAEVMPNGRSYFGSSMDGAFGSGFVTTHTLPRQPLVSMASFQHSFANGFNRLAASGLTGYPAHGNGDPEIHNRMIRLPLLPQISHAIGNSLAPSVLAPDEISHEPTAGARNPHPLADHSYLANRELWDDYFLSGIAPQPAPAFTDERDQETVALEFFRDGTALPVARYLPDTGGDDPADLMSTFFSGGVPTAESINQTASHLRVDGMFNINSTSVEAWKAMLGSLRGRAIVARNEDGEESITTANDPPVKTPVANMIAPNATVIEDQAASAPDRNQNWDGRRELTYEEIDGLARAIVKEVRKRGPFLNLGDFINRRVGDDVDLARAGAIQSALDSDEANINTEQNSGRTVSSTVANRFEFPEAEEGAVHYGAPSLVKQGDILTPIAPVLSARSDSFIIRTYGESQDSSGRVLARAWCEAVVERTRDYVDPSDAPNILPEDLSAAQNQKFGRHFKIISFRWLNPTEI
jgi:hypothetical protein